MVEYITIFIRFNTGSYIYLNFFYLLVLLFYIPSNYISFPLYLFYYFI